MYTGLVLDKRNCGAVQKMEADPPDFGVACLRMARFAETLGGVDGIME